MQFDDRERAFENKFSKDQEMDFKVEARASKLIGLWAAEKLGLSGAEADAYAKEVIVANLDEPGFNDVKRKVETDFANHSVALQPQEFDKAIETCIAEATKQLAEGK